MIEIFKRRPKPKVYTGDEIWLSDEQCREHFRTLGKSGRTIRGSKQPGSLERLWDRLTTWSEWRGSFDGRPAFFIKRLVRVAGRTVQVHKFVRADDPGCFHTHPAYAIRIVLWGGYVEELGDGRKVIWRPGNIGKVPPELEHRIDSLLNGKSSWSLWIRGKKVADIGIRGC